MATPNSDDVGDQSAAASDQTRVDDDCLASGLRRKFLEFCRENPSADECRLYDV